MPLTKRIFFCMKYFLTVLLVIPGAATAQQPYSHSMAQCSALSYALSEWSSKEDIRDLALQMSELWFDEALTQARAEGMADAYEKLTEIANTAESDWLSKGSTYVFTGDFRDWVSYCRKFGQHVGLEIPIE